MLLLLCSKAYGCKVSKVKIFCKLLKYLKTVILESYHYKWYWNATDKNNMNMLQILILIIKQNVIWMHF